MVNPEDLFVLSDVMQIELFVSSSGKISGKMSKMVQIPEIGLKLNLSPEVVSSKVTADMIGIILKVQGNLYTAAIHDRKAGMVAVLVLDQGKLADKLVGFFETYPKNTFSALLNLLRKGAVAESSKQEYGDLWTQRQAA